MATAAELRVPSPTTLRKYGLSREQWEVIADRQGRVCGVCHRLPGTKGILHIDHEHVRGWKRMPPEERRQYVRGLACWKCNSVWLRRGATPDLLRSAALFLEAYERLREGVD